MKRIIFIVVVVCLLFAGCVTYNDAERIEVHSSGSIYVIDSCRYSIADGIGVTHRYDIKVFKGPVVHEFEGSECDKIIITHYRDSK